MKVLLVYDVDGWAFHRIALGLAKWFPSEHSVAIASHEKFYATQERVRHFDVQVNLSIHTGFYSDIPVLTWICADGFCFSNRLEDDWRTRAVTKDRCLRRAIEVGKNTKGLLVCNRFIAQQLALRLPQAQIKKIRKVHQGVDDTIFTPGSEGTGPLIAGWCARRTDDMKGHAEVLAPLIERTKDRWTWQLNERQFSDAYNAEEMANWYRGLDLFVCTSMSEGGPLTVFEAAACGVPVLSTKVGTVREWTFLSRIGMRALPYHNKQQAAEIVEWMAVRMAFFERNPIRNRQFQLDAQQNWSWRVLAPKWADAIEGLLNARI